jgi:outer membrane protein assembly factor BamE (lipoprotein component of BamABCDE complex)
MKQIFFIILGSLVLSSCSVGMAMSGKEEPNLGMVQVGASRGEIELTLGTPGKTVTLENGNRMDVYEYQVGNTPSAGRAAGHAVMDLLTLGLWEVIGTPVEAMQGDKRTLTIIYDRDDRVLSINSILKKKKHKSADKNNIRRRSFTPQKLNIRYN